MLSRHNLLLWSVTCLALGVGVAGCTPRWSKNGDTLDRVESELEKTGAALKAIDDKPVNEAVAELDRISEEHRHVLEELTALSNGSFTKEEKDRFTRVLARAKERQEQIKESTARVRAKMKPNDKE